MRDIESDRLSLLRKQYRMTAEIGGFVSRLVIAIYSLMPAT